MEFYVHEPVIKKRTIHENDKKKSNEFKFTPPPHSINWYYINVHVYFSCQ